MRLLLVLPGAWGVMALAAFAETHASLQAVDQAGASVWSGTFPISLRGVLLCDPEEMLDGTPRFLSWNNGANAGQMGGEWQITFQAIDPGDRGGTTCWMGQNYANRIPPHDDAFSYSNPAWVAEVNRLNYDPATGHRFRAGDLIEITAQQALFFGGKRNINEGHDVSPSADFTVSLVASNYGLPAPEVLTLADVVRTDDGNPATSEDIFDSSRQTGGEHWQGMRVRINGLQMVTTNGWNPTNVWNDRKCTVTDGLGRYFTLRHPRSSLGPAPAKRFDAVGIFTQESGSGIQGTNGYELFVQEVIPQEAPVLAIAQKLAITWPATGAACQLEYRTDLNPTNWYPVDEVPALIEGQYTVLVAPAAPQRFYRLRKIN